MRLEEIASLAVDALAAALGPCQLIPSVVPSDAAIDRPWTWRAISAADDLSHVHSAIVALAADAQARGMRRFAELPLLSRGWILSARCTRGGISVRVQAEPMTNLVTLTYCGDQAA
jgi:hypothetical protein